MGVPNPIDIGLWDVTTIALFDDASVVHTTEILPDVPRPMSLYELHNIHMSMSEDGTGDLASMGITDEAILLNSSISNTDGALMSVRSNMNSGFRSGNVYWHMGRSNQLGAGIGSPVITFPPRFYWAGGLHGIFQNGAGAGIEFLWTAIFRVVTFAMNDFKQLIAKCAPRSAVKERRVST